MMKHDETLKHYVGNSALSNGISQHLNRVLVILFLSGISVGFGHSLYAEAPSGQGQPTRVEILETPTTLTWESPLLGRSLSCALHRPDSGLAKHPAVVYLKNLPSPRLGQLDDETLIQQFIRRGMMVFEVDYENDLRAAAPELLPEIDRWYGYLFEAEDHPVDKDWIYIVPEGYTIDRKIEICEMKGRLVGMDVIYPSGQTDPVPLMLQITSTKERGKWINQRAYYIYGLLTTGYAGAIMDWNGTGPGATPGGDVFPEKRAARLLRARARNWNLSGRIGVTGHSKGSGRAGKAALINEGNWEADRGPYAEKSDRFQVALLSAGQHAPEFLIEDGFHKPIRQSKDELARVSSLTYVTPDDPPVFLSVGELDREFRVKQMKRVAARCDEVGVTYRLFVQKGMGHMYNPRPEVIGHIYSFLDWHLKPESRAGTSLPSQAELDRLADEVLVVTPSSPSDETSTDVATKNESPDVAIIAAPEKPVAEVEAGDPPELQPYLWQSTMWHCAKLEKDVPLNVYFADKRSTSPQQAPVIVYVKGLAAKRVGQESDLAILSDYIKQRYIVISVDYGGDARAVSPAIDQDLHAILGTIYGTGRDTLRRGMRTEESPLLGDLGLEPAYARCFFLPAGYRVATDLVFWEVDKHGSHGTMKRVVRAYNEQVVDETGRHHIPGRSPISSPDELIERDGSPLDRKYHMDIIYPSQADKKVPLIFWISTTTIRAPSSNPSGYRPHMLGFPMRGYAYAIIDHCYNPVALRYGHYKGHALSNINGLKAYTAAIRFLRAHAGAYNVDPRYIGGWGHSKGAYALTRLSDPNHAERGVERQRLEDEPEGSPEPQPWPGYSSRIAAGYQSMGNGTRWSAQYVTADYTPTLVACGELDHFNHWLDWPRVVDAYERANANHVALGMLGLGHELPYGRDEELGVDRYELVMSFFDRYLKVGEKLAPVVLFTTPRDQETDIEPSATISVQFAPVMDEASIVDGRGVKIIKSRDGSPVKGFWTSSRKGARFTFKPKEDFRAGEKYKVIVTTHVKNEAGTPLDEARIAEFTVGKMVVETKTSAAKKPAIVALESIGAVVEVEWTGSEQFAVKVDLRSGKVTDAELEHVKRLTRLRELRLDGIPITDDGLKYLQEMTSLQRLDLPNTRITDNGLSYLRELKNLSALSIKGNRVTDAGLKHLQGLTNLEMLSLGPNQISDIGVKSLRDLTKLRYLNLTDTQVTDSVFEYLKPLTNLRTLRLRGTRVTEKGVQDMKQTLPNCNVSR